MATTLTQNGIILYDDALIEQPVRSLFEPDFWDKKNALRATEGGRGASWIIRRDNGDWVLRHYRRGGAMRFLDDRYLHFGTATRTRPWREWHYLAQMRERGLPVPRPVAARVTSRGLIWRGDLITGRVADARPLSSWLKVRDLDAPPWRGIGQLLARFHAAGAAHPDLNAHNILIQAGRVVWLIDFDRGGWRPPNGHWAGNNLARLKRSLIKLTDETAIENAWRELMAGYKNPSSS